jgi:hypothetical protein
MALIIASETVDQSLETSVSLTAHLALANEALADGLLSSQQTTRMFVSFRLLAVVQSLEMSSDFGETNGTTSSKRKQSNEW